MTLDPQRFSLAKRNVEAQATHVKCSRFIPLPNYRETTAASEKKQTGFPDWSNEEWKAFLLDFYTRFAEKYDVDSRLAFVQAGFGLWAEYHIYDGPYGIPFAEQAAKYHVSFIIGDDQPRFQSADVIRNAGMACGYRFKVTQFLTSATASELEIANAGIEPIYQNAYPAVDGIRSATALKGLLPGESRRFRVAQGGTMRVITIECDRLVPGQKIEFEANLPKLALRWCSQFERQSRYTDRGRQRTFVCS